MLLYVTHGELRMFWHLLKATSGRLVSTFQWYEIVSQFASMWFIRTFQCNNTCDSFRPHPHSVTLEWFAAKGSRRSAIVEATVVVKIWECSMCSLDQSIACTLHWPYIRPLYLTIFSWIGCYVPSLIVSPHACSCYFIELWQLYASVSILIKISVSV